MSCQEKIVEKTWIARRSVVILSAAKSVGCTTKGKPDEFCSSQNRISVVIGFLAY